MMFTAQEISEATGFPTYEQMKEWCKANAEDRLLILPCKVGDTVYRIQYVADPKSSSGYVIGVAPLKFSLIFIDEVGKTVFLTREEAEAALKGGADGW